MPYEQNDIVMVASPPKGLEYILGYVAPIYSVAAGTQKFARDETSYYLLGHELPESSLVLLDQSNSGVVVEEIRGNFS